MNHAFFHQLFCFGVAASFSAVTLFAQSRQETSVQSAAGGSAQSTSFSLIATVGQSSPLGEASAGQFTMSSGFNYTLESGLLPTAITNAATNLTTTAAILNATVNPNGASTMVKFQYGTTTSYGSEITATPSPVSGTSPVAVTANLTGLIPNTLYHYRVVATNSAGTSNGSDQTLTTTQGLATVTTENATNIGSNSATLNGTVNPNNSSTAVKFQYGTTVLYGSEITAMPSPVTGMNIVAVSAMLTGLNQGTLYHFRIVATNGAGTTEGPDQTFTTLPAVTAPTVTTVRATDVTTTTATLIGAVNPNNASTAVKFQYGTTTSYGNEIDAISSPLTGSSVFSVSAMLAGLTPNTLYHFRVVATNSAGTSNGADATFMTTGNQPSSITHTAPSTPQPENQAVSLQATITDDGPIDSVRVFLKYRQGGATTPFDSTAMTRVGAGSTFTGVIPPDKTTGGRGVEYFIKAVDNGSPPLTAFLPPTGVFSLSIQVSKLVNLRDQPAAGSQRDRTAYRLISIPLLLDNNPSAVSILQAKFGVYDSTRWRLYGIDPARSQHTNVKNPYVEITSGGDLSPGRSLFLIVKEANQRLEAGPGRTNKIDGEFSMTLDPGHNFVATPFNFTIPKDKLRLSSNEPVVLWSYNGGAGFEQVNTLKEWEGNYIANNNPTAVTLFVNPSLGDAPRKTQAKPATSGWRAQIAASCGRARDFENFVGVDVASVDRWDYNDVVEPPPFGDFVSLYFEHPEWEKVFHRYADDIRSAAHDNHQWTFRVDTNIPNEIVTLRFEGIANLAPELDVFVVDQELNYKQNLRDNAAYQYQPREIERAKNFTLLVGKADFIDAQTAGVPGVPEDFVLEQNFPNPFNRSTERSRRSPETTIRFGLPKTSVVTIKILDLNGREIATVLYRIELPAGRHQRMWNGRDDHGRLVTSGLYLYQLRAGNFSKTLKLTLLK